MTAFIDGLMAKMTIQENIEQFNLLSASTITTGAKKESPMLDLITQGKLGAILNMKGFEDVCTLQGDGRRAEPSRDSTAHGPRRHPRPQDRRHKPYLQFIQFFLPYEAGAKARTGSFMTSFNVIDYSQSPLTASSSTRYYAKTGSGTASSTPSKPPSENARSP